MSVSTTEALLRVATTLHELRAVVDDLSHHLLADDHGVSRESFARLSRLRDCIGGMQTLRAVMKQRRFYLPQQETAEI